MGRLRAEHNWKRIDPSLLMACKAFSESDRDRLLEKISARYGFIGARFISPDAGVVAMDHTS
jgi:hypothetical protein